MNRIFLLCVLFFAGCSFLPEGAPPISSDNEKQELHPGRIFIGPEFWANRLQDWRKMPDGKLQCVSENTHRTLHLLTHRIIDEAVELEMSITIDAVKADMTSKAGFLIGAGAENLDYRAAAMVMKSLGPNFGTVCGVENKKLVIRDHEAGVEAWSREVFELPVTLNLKLNGPSLQLEAVKGGRTVASTSFKQLPRSSYLGNIALLSHKGLFTFDKWNIKGSKIDVDHKRSAGPVISTQYTLSNRIMKLTAQLMPVGVNDAKFVTLERKSKDRWVKITDAPIIIPGYTATFKIKDWDSKSDTAVRVKYELDGKSHYYEGLVTKEPLDRDELIMAAFTGNHNMQRGLQNDGYSWSEDNLWFPHNDIVNNVKKHGADVLFFSGDQVYENDSPTPADKSGGEASHIDYLYKWYLWCWAFRDITKDRPTILIMDDHDVYQGNIWGDGGAKMTGVITDGNSNTPVAGWANDDKTGYVLSAEWVKMTERTQTSHLPDPYDPSPVKQGIGVYYTSMNYAGVSMAILEDRKFKSGCKGLIPGLTGREDHIKDPNFDTKTLDLPELKLYGDRQLKFLKDWGQNWENHEMKLILSQTIPANMATHHGWSLNRMYADLDSNGWPQSKRNEALRVMRKSFAPLIGGDQHLSSMVQHGVDDWKDSLYSFCVPSIANFYPRAWMPENAGINRMDKEPHFGDHIDGFGNKVTVHAVTNPTALSGISVKQPYALHNKMPGYGIVKVNKAKRTYTFESWNRYADPQNEKPYPGWPFTIEQTENYKGKIAGYLQTLNIEGAVDPIVKVYDSKGELVYSLRIKGSTFKPHVFAEGTYQVQVINGTKSKTVSGMIISSKTVTVKF